MQFRPLAHSAPAHRIPSTHLCVSFQAVTPASYQAAGVKGVYFVQYVDPCGDTWPRRAVAVALDDSLRVLDTTKCAPDDDTPLAALPTIDHDGVQDVIALIQIYTTIARHQHLHVA